MTPYAWQGVLVILVNAVVGMRSMGWLDMLVLAWLASKSLDARSTKKG